MLRQSSEILFEFHTTIGEKASGLRIYIGQWNWAIKRLSKSIAYSYAIYQCFAPFKPTSRR